MKRELILIALAMIIFNLNILAEEIPGCLSGEPSLHYKHGVFSSGNYGKLKEGLGLYDMSNTLRPYDVLKYDLYLDWHSMLSAQGTTGPDRQWTGSNKITLKIDSASVSKLDFDAVGLLIQSVEVDDIKLNVTPQPISNILSIPLQKTYNPGDTAVISINYKYVTDTNNGFWLYPKHYFVNVWQPPFNDSVFTEERVAYMSNEPNGSRFWMPCNDYPHDKAEATISVKVPLAYSAGANGLLTNVYMDADTVVYIWHDDIPISTYLMSVAASKYKIFSHWYHRITNPADSVEVMYYVWQKDYDATKTDGSEFNARNSFRNTTTMMEYFSGLFGEFPFKKYGMAAVLDFLMGGMENQTFTLINRNWLRYDDQIGIAHELSHQWLGDMMTCKTWKDIWIHEGGATLSECLWIEKSYGREVYLQQMLNPRAVILKYGGLKLPPMYGIPDSSLFIFDPDHIWAAVLIYDKASWVYHMLRTMLGDSAFFGTLRQMLKTYAYSSINTEEFKNTFKKYNPNPQVDLDTCFDQWVYKAGYPVFSLTTGITELSGKYKATINISQVQKDTLVPDVFNVPIRFVFMDKDSAKFADTVLMTKRSQVFEVNLPFIPINVTLDTTHILCEIRENILSVRENEAITGNNELVLYPNPVSAGKQCSVDFRVAGSGKVNVKIYNSLGQIEKEIYSGYLSNGGYTFNFLTGDMASGNYMLVINHDGKTLSKAFCVIR